MGAQAGMIYAGHCLSVDGLDSRFGDPCQAILQKELLVRFGYDRGHRSGYGLCANCEGVIRFKVKSGDKETGESKDERRHDDQTRMEIHN